MLSQGALVKGHCIRKPPFFSGTDLPLGHLFFFSSSLCKKYRHLLSALIAFIFRTRRRTEEKGKACHVSLGQQGFDGAASKARFNPASLHHGGKPSS